MEKFYEVLPECSLYRLYFEWWEYLVATNKVVKEFAPANGIESVKYYAGTDCFAIVPTDKDNEKFVSQLKKDALSNGLVFFKKNSAINKAWIQAVKENGIKCAHKPMPSFYFGIWGKGKSRLFHRDNTLYMSFSMDRDFDKLENCREMKGSEFYKIMEDMDAAAEKEK